MSVRCGYRSEPGCAAGAFHRPRPGHPNPDPKTAHAAETVSGRTAMPAGNVKITSARRQIPGT